MILIINVCEEDLHYYEFVKPIEDILVKDFVTMHHFDVGSSDLEKADKVIICGTSLKDNAFLEDLHHFEWIKGFDKPILGICAGMQIIGLIYGGKLKEHLEIGYFHEGFEKRFLGLEGEQEVFHLHNNWVQFIKDFEKMNLGKITHAVKHKERPIYGVLFHPEVRQKEMILEFARL